MKQVLPIFRSLVAKELVEKYHLTQIEVAERLGITQAAISQYLHSKRGCRTSEKYGDVYPIIEDAAKEMAETIASRSISPNEVMLNFCRLCALLRREEKIP